MTGLTGPKTKDGFINVPVAFGATLESAKQSDFIATSSSHLCVQSCHFSIERNLCMFVKTFQFPNVNRGKKNKQTCNTFCFSLCNVAVSSAKSLSFNEQIQMKIKYC